MHRSAQNCFLSFLLINYFCLVSALRNNKFVYFVENDSDTDTEAKAKQHSVAGTTVIYRNANPEEGNQFRQLNAMGPTNETIFMLVSQLL